MSEARCGVHRPLCGRKAGAVAPSPVRSGEKLGRGRLVTSGHCVAEGRTHSRVVCTTLAAVTGLEVPAAGQAPHVAPKHTRTPLGAPRGTPAGMARVTVLSAAVAREADLGLWGPRDELPPSARPPPVLPPAATSPPGPPRGELPQ